MPRQHAKVIGFIGEVANVSEDGGYGFILAHTIRREDDQMLGMEIDEDVFIHTRSGKRGDNVDLRNGMEVSFLIGPNERHGGKLRAFFVEEA